MRNSLIILLLLAGCQTIPTPSILETTTKKQIVVDQELMKDCANLISIPYPKTQQKRNCCKNT